MLPVQEITVPEKLMQHGVAKIVIEGSTIVIMYNKMPIRFDIDKNKKWFKTIENFEKASKGIIADDETKQAIIFCLSDNWMNLQDVAPRTDTSNNHQRSGYDQLVNDDISSQKEQV